MVIALGGGIGAYYVATNGGGAPAGTANLWVDTNGGTCTRQSAPGHYVVARRVRGGPPTTKLQAETRSSSPAHGSSCTYPPQCAYSRALGTNVVTIAEAPDKTSHLRREWLRRMRQRDGRLPDHSVLCDLRWLRLHEYSRSSRDSRIRESQRRHPLHGSGREHPVRDVHHAELRGSGAAAHHRCFGYGMASPSPANQRHARRSLSITSTFTTSCRDSGGKHTDCIQFYGYNHATLKNSVLDDCETSG